jgi:hypothetical protein
MKILKSSKLPDVGLPKVPALILESAQEYGIWTGRNWHGHIYKHGRYWVVNTPGSCEDSFRTFNDARTEAEHRALRAEGRV